MEIQMWKEILNPYELAVEELQVKFNHMVKEYRQAGIYSPIEQVLGRVKSISSILGKAQKQGIGIDQIEGKILDIAGIRLICQFTDDIYNVADLIRARSDMEVIKGTKVIPVEIQIRTLGMNFWAIIEHSLQYKYNGNIPSHVRERLTSAADAIYTLDNEMMSIHEEIIDAQNFVSTKANIVSDILNNIQSLYKVANKQEIIKIQDEFYEIYETEDVAKLQRFSRQLDMIAENYKAQSI